jgi:rare lipoprotein A
LDEKEFHIIAIKMNIRFIITAFSICLLLFGCREKLPDRYSHSEVGFASYYSKSLHNKKTASGEPYNMYALTAAHRSLSLGTYVIVTNLNNGKSVTVKINDRGPKVKDRIINLSFEAAKKLEMLEGGVVKVKIVQIKGDK